MDTGTLISKVNKYKHILENTLKYRESWHKNVKPLLTASLDEILKQSGLAKGEIIVRDNIANLEAVVFDLGRSSSGISENLDDSGVMRTMIKSNGSLIYQQLFNGKIMVMTVSPHIEGYGQPKPPTTLEILRPEEINQKIIIKHLETFFDEITEWEDYDDDEQRPNTIGFNPTGVISHPEEA